MHVSESIRMALDAVKLNKLRSGLTLLSIAIGVFAIIGAGVASTSLSNSLSSQVDALGQNSVQYSRWPSLMFGGGKRSSFWSRKPLTYEQGKMLRNSMRYADAVSVNISQSGVAVRFENEATDPNVTLIGTDGDYFNVNLLNIKMGRPLVEEDVTLNRPVVVVGWDIVKLLFRNGGNPIGSRITINGRRFDIVGVMEQRGSALGQSLDLQVIIPVNLYLRNFGDGFRQSLDIIAKAPNSDVYQKMVDEGIGLLRIARNVKPGEDNDFEVETGESVQDTFSSITTYVGGFGLASGLIALVAAGVGIMNIMLVTVKERTREIGVRKALGARRSAILTQFIVEAITLCQIGGLSGIALGILGGYGITVAMELDVFSIPWDWVGGAIATCTLMGLTFGAYPAWKAASADPIEALRYE